MRILYLIGNGFDLHVGLKTGYQSFLEYYLKQPIPEGLDNVGIRYIRRLKEDIKTNIQLWSELELQFGKHTSKMGTMGSSIHSLQEEFDIINDDMREKLSAYIAQEDKRSYFAENARKVFLEDIIEPCSGLRDYEKALVDRHKTNFWGSTTNDVGIITFNYTRTIEHLLGTMPIQSSGFEIHEPIHVHGYYNQRMILGVNDVSQIENEKLRENDYVVDAIVKSNCNHTYEDAHTNKCKRLISTAQLICCYGLSFGDTDKTWWKEICDALKNRGDLIVILFSHINNMPNYSNSGHKLQNQMKQIRDGFLDKGGLGVTTKQGVEKRVLVILNDGIFNIQVNT